MHNTLLSLYHLHVLASVQCLAASLGQQSVPLVLKAQQHQASEDDHHRVCVGSLHMHVAHVGRVCQTAMVTAVSTIGLQHVCASH